MRQVTGRNSQAVTPVLIHFFKGIKNAKLITIDRGSNEVLNLYVRRFIPKERKIETVSAKELD